MIGSRVVEDSGRQYRLVTSRDDSASGKKYVDVSAGEKLALCRLLGAGRIVRLWLTLPLFRQRHALKDTVLRMYWDGESEPSVEVPLGDFFGAAFGKPARFVSEPLRVVGGAYVSLLEMPFNDGAVLELHNDSDETLRTLFFQVGYYEEPTRADAEPTLHAQFNRESKTTDGKPFTALRAVGAGRLAGLRVDLQARDFWLKPPFSEILLPRGFGLGILEGWERIVVDGDRERALTGTGAEDYFSGGFYFEGGPFSTPSYGSTVRSFFTGRVSAYRFHLDDPIFFGQSLEITLDHGLSNTMTGDYTSVAYWYQREPHATFPPLPDRTRRRPTFPLANPLQWFLLAGGAALVVAFVAYALML